MNTRLIPTILAAAFLATLPLETALARGGGGGGNSGHSDGGRGSASYSRPQGQSRQQLYDQAHKDCSGPKYPSGATPRINYDAGTFSCFEPGTTRR